MILNYLQYSEAKFFQIWLNIYHQVWYMVYNVMSIFFIKSVEIFNELMELIKQLLSFKGIFIALSIYTMHKGFNTETLAGLISFTGAGTYKIVQDYQKYKTKKPEGKDNE